MDAFEKHIRQNREELDRIEQPDADRLWQAIQSEGPPPPPPPQQGGSRNWLWGLLLLITGLGIGYLLRPQLPPVPEQEPIELPRALLEEEQNYQQLVRQKMEAINFAAINPTEYQEIFEELQLLEQSQEELKKDLPQFGHHERLIHTLMRYYERKIRILEILSKEIEKKEHHEKRSHEQSI
ncbi:MAG: hypothetical protein AAGG75_16885 [Bacteroidota bacterium]